ncbi:PAS domain-containing protein [Halorubrum ezzemoulense]|uniref:histidine kinase n=1 Tax=Halorubrum ezzemoulense TaxID=337243 RepID=A0A481RLJ6_HALEZ|nr:PAS domain-containing protein [Halorubrum ezzemoulense]QAY21849.1 PAS domain S-box protein [Halorubrum ezzemoulense]
MNGAGKFAPGTSPSEVLERVTDPLFALDERGALSFVNEPASDLFGSADGVPLDETVWEQLRDGFGAETAARLQHAFETRETLSVTAYDGSDRQWVRIGTHPSATGMTVTVSPAPDGDRTRLSEAADAAIDGIAILDDEEYVYMNRAHAAIFDFEPDELLGESWRRLYGDAEQERIERDVFPQLEREGEWRGETEGRRRDGSGVPQDVSLSLLDDGTLVCVNKDITERKARERELEQTREFLERAQASAAVGGWEVDLTTESLHWTDEVYRIHELPLDARISLQDGFDFYHPEDRGVVTDAFDRLVDEGESYDLELRIVTAEDRTRWIRTVGEPRTDANGDVVAAVGVFQEITDRKRRDEQLAQLRERLDLAVEGANLGVWDWDMTTDEVVFNDRWATMLGLSPDDIEPSLDTWEERVNPDDISRVKAALNAHIDGETEMYDCDHRMRTAEGDWLWIRDAGKIVDRDADGRPTRAVGIHLDISAQKEQEAAIERARNELRQIIDLVPDLIFAKRDDGTYLLANEATAEAYGLTVAETEGCTDAEILPDSAQSTHFRADDQRVIESDEQLEIPEEELTTADGETRLFQTTKIPYRVAGTDDDAMLGYARDITPLRRYEHRLERQRDNLSVLNKIVRHDIRNALQVVSGSAELLEHRLDTENHRLLKAIRTAAAEAVDITVSAREVTELLMEFDSDPEPVALTPVLTRQIDAVRSSDRSVSVTRVGKSDEKPVLADEMLKSVFRNLLHNAVVHNDGDSPSIRVSTDALPGRVRVAVADDGPGVPDDLKRTVFDEGTQGIDSEGTGLGLYLVKTLVDRYGGAVWVEDSESGGARFVVELPRVDAE